MYIFIYSYSYIYIYLYITHIFVYIAYRCRCIHRRTFYQNEGAVLECHGMGLPAVLFPPRWGAGGNGSLGRPPLESASRRKRRCDHRARELDDLAARGFGPPVEPSCSRVLSTRGAAFLANLQQTFHGLAQSSWCVPATARPAGYRQRRKQGYPGRRVAVFSGTPAYAHATTLPRVRHASSIHFITRRQIAGYSVLTSCWKGPRSLLPSLPPSAITRAAYDRSFAACCAAVWYRCW